MHDEYDNDKITLLAVPPSKGLEWSGKLFVGKEEIGVLFGQALSDLEDAANELGFPPDHIRVANS
ncbi:hypothetical protein [Caballeronia glebae]|uniref:hypothetical protein n=1 Tax=Caballeronia glebae TaxID=1777143 RepID=UPI0038BAF606